MNDVVTRFRTKFPSDPRSDDEITSFLAGNFPGKFDGYSDFTADIQRIKGDQQAADLAERRENAPSLLQEMNLGLGRGMEGLLGTLKGGAALGLRALPGDFADEASDQLLERSKEHSEAAAEYGGTIRRVEDIQSASDFIRWVSGGIGEVTPSLIEAIGTAVAGGVAGTATGGPVGTVGGFMAGIVGKKAAKNLIKKEVKEILEERAQREVGKATVDSVEGQLKKIAAGKMVADEASDTVKELLSKEMRSTRRRWGANTAVMLNSHALQSGEVFNELTNNGIAPDEALNTAVLGGFVGAAPDSALPWFIINSFTGGVPPGLKKPFIQRVLGHWAVLPAAVGAEAATESFQELVSIMSLRFEQGGINAMDPSRNPLTEEDVSRLKNAGALGAVGGGLAGVGAYTFNKLLSPEQEKEDRDKADRMQKTGKHGDKIPRLRAEELQQLANDEFVEKSMGGVTLGTQSKIQAIPEGSIPAFQLFRIAIERRMKSGEIDLTRDSSLGELKQEEQEAKAEGLDDNEESLIAAIKTAEGRGNKQEVSRLKALRVQQLAQIARANEAASANPDLARRVLEILGQTSVPEESSDRVLDDLQRRGEVTPSQIQDVREGREDQRNVELGENFDPDRPLGQPRPVLVQTRNPDGSLSAPVDATPQAPADPAAPFTVPLDHTASAINRQLGVSEVDLGNALGRIPDQRATISAEGVDLSLGSQPANRDEARARPGQGVGAVAPATRSSRLEEDGVTGQQLDNPVTYPLTEEEADLEQQRLVQEAVVTAQNEESAEGSGIFGAGLFDEGNVVAENEGTPGTKTHGEASEKQQSAKTMQKWKRRLKHLAGRQKTEKDALGRRKLSEVVDPADTKALEEQAEAAILAEFADMTLEGPNPRSDVVVMIDLRDTQNVSLEGGTESISGMENAPFVGTFILTNFKTAKDAIDAFSKSFADFGGADLIGAASVINQERLDAYRRTGKRQVGVKTTKDPRIPFARLSSFKGKIPEGVEPRDIGSVKGKVNRTITQAKQIQFKISTSKKRGQGTASKWTDDQVDEIVLALQEEGIQAHAGETNRTAKKPAGRNASVIVYGSDDIYASGKTDEIFNKARRIIKGIDSRDTTEVVKKTASAQDIYETQDFESQFPAGDLRVEQFTLAELTRSLLNSVDWENNHDVEVIGTKQDPGAFNPRAWFRIMGIADPSLLTAQFTGSGKSKNATATRRFTFFLFPDGKVRLLGTKRSPTQSGQARDEMVMAWPEHETSHAGKKKGDPRYTLQGVNYNAKHTDSVSGMVSIGKAVPLTDALEAGAIPIASIKLSTAQNRTTQRTIATANWTLAEFEDLFAREADLMSDANRPRNYLTGETDAAGNMILDDKGFTKSQNEEAKNLDDLSTQQRPSKFSVDEDGNVTAITPASRLEGDKKKSRESDFNDSTSNTATNSAAIANTYDLVQGMYELAPMEEDGSGIVRDREKSEQGFQDVPLVKSDLSRIDQDVYEESESSPEDYAESARPKSAFEKKYAKENPPTKAEAEAEAKGEDIEPPQSAPIKTARFQVNDPGTEQARRKKSKNPKTLTKRSWNKLLDTFAAQSDNKDVWRWMLARSGAIILKVWGPNHFIGISYEENVGILRDFIQQVTYKAYEQGKFDTGKSVVKDFFESSEENLQDALNLPKLKSVSDGVQDLLTSGGQILRSKNTTRFTLVDVDLIVEEQVGLSRRTWTEEEKRRLKAKLTNRQNLTQDWIEYVRYRAIMSGRGNPSSGKTADGKNKPFDVVDFDPKKAHEQNRSDLAAETISEYEFDQRKIEITEMEERGVGKTITRVKAAIDRSADPALAPIGTKLMYPSIFGYGFQSPERTDLEIAVARNEIIKDVRNHEAYTETMAALRGLTSSKDKSKQAQNEDRSRRAFGWSISLPTGEDIEVSEETFNVLHRGDLPPGSRLQTLHIDLTTGSPTKSPGEIQQEANELNALIASWSELSPEQMANRHERLMQWGLIEAAERYAYGLLQNQTVTQSEAEAFAGGEISSEAGAAINAERGTLAEPAEAPPKKIGTLESLDATRRKAQSEANEIAASRMFMEFVNNESEAQEESTDAVGRYDFTAMKPSGAGAIAYPAQKTRGPRASVSDPIVKAQATPIGKDPALTGRLVPLEERPADAPAEKRGIDWRALLREQPSNPVWLTEEGKRILAHGGPNGTPLQAESQEELAAEAEKPPKAAVDPTVISPARSRTESGYSSRIEKLIAENQADQSAPRPNQQMGSRQNHFSRPTSLPAQDVLSEEGVWDLVARLRDAGINVELLDLQLDALTAELLGFHVAEDGNPVENALFNSTKATIVHAMRDTMNPTLESLRILMHETGHMVTMAESEEVQNAVYFAIGKLNDEQLGITESRDPRIVKPPAPVRHMKKRWLTDDGYVFYQQDDGTLTSAYPGSEPLTDMKFESVDHLAEEMGPPRLMGPTEVRSDMEGEGLPDGWTGFMEGSDPESADPTIADVIAETAASDELTGGLLQFERLAEALSFYGIRVEVAKTLAAQIIRHIKDVLMRSAMWIQRQLLGPEHVNPNLAFAFVKNRFDMFRGKPAPFMSFIGGRNLNSADMPDLHGAPVHGEGWVKEYLAPDGSVATEQGFAEIGDTKTLFNNVFGQSVFYNKPAQSILSKPEAGGDNATAIATPWSAAMQSLEDSFQIMFAEVGNTGLIDDMTYDQFLKKLGHPVAPMTDVNKLNLALQANGKQPVPNVTADKLQGGRGNLIYVTHLRKVHKRFGRKIAAMQRVIATSEKKKAKKTDRLNKLELNYKNLDLVHKNILVTFKNSIRKFGNDIRFMGNPRWVKGMLANAVEKISGSFKGDAHESIADDLFKKISKSDTAFMNFMERIAGLGIDFTGSPESIIEGLSTPDAKEFLQSRNDFATMMRQFQEAMTDGPKTAKTTNLQSLILYGLIRDLQVSNPAAMAWLEVRNRQNLADDHPNKITPEETLALKAMIAAIKEEAGFITPQHEKLLTELSKKSRAVGALASEYNKHKAEMRALDRKIEEAKKFDKESDALHNSFLGRLSQAEAIIGAVEPVEMIEGAMLVVAPSEGATLAEVERANDMGKKLKGDKWSKPNHKRFRFTRRTGRGEDRNAAKMHEVIVVNDKWLKNNEGNQGLIYNTIYDTNMKLKMEEMSPIHRAMRNNLFTKFLSSIITRLRLTGTDGGRAAARRITLFDAATQEFESEANVRGSRWEVARGEAVKAMPSLGTADLFMEIVYDSGLKFIENHNYLVEGSVKGEDGDSVANPQEEALKLLKEHLESNKTIAKDIPAAWPAIKELFLETQSINNWFNLTVRVKLGIKVKDDVLGLLRESVGAPLFTVSRTLHNRLGSLHYDMSRIGWPGTSKLTDEQKLAGEEPKDLAFNKPNPPPIEDLVSAYMKDPGALAAKLSLMTPAAVVEGFIKPIVEDTAKSHFSSPMFADGIKNIATIDNVMAAWKDSYIESTGGVDLVKFAELLYQNEDGPAKLAARNEAAQLRARPNKEGVTLPVEMKIEDDMAQFVGDTIDTFYQFFGQISRILIEQEQSALKVGDKNTQTLLPHQLMDSRRAENFPAAFLSYATYDQSNARIMASQMAVHAYLGRDMRSIESDIGSAKGEMERFAREYERLIAEFRRDNPSANPETVSPWKRKKFRRQLEAAARVRAEEMGENPEEFLDKIVGAYEGLPMMNKMMSTLLAWFEAQGSGLVENKAAMELLNTMTGSIIQGPKTTLLNFMSMFDPIAKYGPSKVARKQVIRNWKSLMGETLGSFFQMFNHQLLMNTENVLRRNAVGRFDSSHHLTLKKRLQAVWTQEISGGKIQRGLVRGARMTREILLETGISRRPQETQGADGEVNSLNAKGPQYPVFRPHASFSTFVQIMNNSMIDGTWEAYGDMVERGVKFAKDPESSERFLEAGFEFTAEDLGYKRRLFGFSDDKLAFQKMKVTMQNYGINFEHAVAAAMEEGAPLFTDTQYARLASMTLREISLESSITNQPTAFMTQDALRFSKPLLGWSFAKMDQLRGGMRDANDQRYQFMTAMKMFGAMVPIGMAWTLLMDEYDEKVTGKKSNLRPFMNPLNPEHEFLDVGRAFLERTARVGSFGFAGDIAHGLANFQEGGNTRGISFDHRVVFMNALQGFMQSTTALGRTGLDDATYSSVWRPMMQAMGGTGYIQYAQIINNTVSPDIPFFRDEARVTRRINAQNYLRAMGREMNLDVRTGSGSRSLTNEIKPHVSEMILASLSNDSVLFDMHKREALKQAEKAIQKKGKMMSIAEIRKEAESRVKLMYQSSHPLRVVFKTTPTEMEFKDILSNLPDDGRKDVSEAVNLINSFGERHLGVNPNVGSGAKRKKASTGKRSRSDFQRAATMFESPFQ